MRSFGVLILVFVFTAGQLNAAVIEFANKLSWRNTVDNNYTDIPFTGFPSFTLITTQYAELGVTFTDLGGDYVLVGDPTFPPTFLNDGCGLWGGHQDSIEMAFAQPINWIAVDFPGTVEFQLYGRGALLYDGLFDHGGVGWFAGLVSTEAFDFVRISDPTDGSVAIDDLYFGAPIPAPGAVALLALAGVVTPRRRRS